mmetsp:Transcript_15561/g.23177  ORF Transcript_15561/g.23177 Transcript_15561/m.23177 type:complete len:221 (+) Transcript_15561:77-739(+)
MNTRRLLMYLTLSLLHLFSPVDGSDEAKQNPNPKIISTNLYELDSYNFEKTMLSEKGPWMISFTASWCKHCKILAPSWQEAAFRLNGSVKFARIDGPENIFLAKRFEINSYPTIFFVDEKRNVYPFKGVASAENLHSFAEYQYSFIEKLPNSKNPFNLKGSLKGWLIAFGAHIQLVYERLRSWGVPSWVLILGLLMFGVLWTLCLVSIPIFFPAFHPHRD